VLAQNTLRAPAGSAILERRSLREQVYEVLRDAIAKGELAPGAFIDLKSIEKQLGISKTPLRDALIQLESEGFVSILPRRGVLVRPLTLEDIRHLYQIIGALESTVLIEVFDRMGREHVERMRALNAEMIDALAADDFDAFYAHNLAFHSIFLDLCDNPRLLSTVAVFKQRLYDFPRKRGFVKQWELRSTREHAALVDLLARSDARGAADYLRDVHWSFAVQEAFIRRYYTEVAEHRDDAAPEG
jgi:DNA-binding GntR family transcriptional regulator